MLMVASRRGSGGQIKDSKCLTNRRINDQPASRLGELLPWNWKGGPAKLAA